jgi:hypothetical protein
MHKGRMPYKFVFFCPFPRFMVGQKITIVYNFSQILESGGIIG